MTIERDVSHQDNYTVLANALINDRRLSFKARGLLVYILAKPSHWKAQVEDLQRAGNCGRDAILSGLQELEDVGYLIRKKTRNNLGQWVHTQIVRETSIYGKGELPGQPDDGFPDLGLAYGG